MPKPHVGYFSPVDDMGLDLRGLAIALVSYLETRSAKGKWLIGFFDIDCPSTKKQVDQWLSALAAFGFDWDNNVCDKNACQINDNLIVKKWLMQGLAYACHCSEEQLKTTRIYSGCCRDALKSTHNAILRLRTPDLNYQFRDPLQGVFSQNISKETGDFVIRNKHGKLDADFAMVLDAQRLGVTQIVRPVEQMHTVAKQLYMQELLGFASPTYLHVPIILNSSYNINSLQSISEREKVELLIYLLERLSQPINIEMHELTTKQLLSKAIENWRIELIAKVKI